MSVPSVCVHTHCSAIEARRSDLLVLDGWVVVSHWTWIAGSELGSSTRAAASLQPVPEISAAVLQGQVSEALMPGGSGQEPDVVVNHTREGTLGCHRDLTQVLYSGEG